MTNYFVDDRNSQSLANSIIKPYNAKLTSYLRGAKINKLTSMLKTCSVPSCSNSSRAASSAEEPVVSFHEFPSEERLRTAWLTALGLPDISLPESAVVCSRHFCADHMSVTESGSRQLRPGAVPSPVLVCMTCLHTGAKLLLMSRQDLREAYVTLTGQPPCDGNLQATVCVRCARTLRSFGRFREQSLRARSLMMGLLQQHGAITMRHVELINREQKQLERDFVTSPEISDHCEFVTSPKISDPCDFVASCIDDKRSTLEENDVEVKTEVDVKIEMLYSEEAAEDGKESLLAADCSDRSIALQARLLDEAAPGTEALALDELKSEHGGDMEDTRELARRQDCAHSLRLVTKIENKACVTEEADTTQRRERALVHRSASHNRPSDSDDEPETIIRHCVVKLYDIFKNPDSLVSIRDRSPTHTRQAVGSCDTLNTCTASEDAQHRAASETEVAASHNEPAASELSEAEPSSSGNRHHIHSQNKSFICDVCQRMFAHKCSLVYHIRTHSKPYSCKLCSYKCAQNSCLVSHIRTHTGEKPYSCNICSYKCAKNSNLVSHMRTHTGEKPYSCKTCSYKCAIKSDLVKHMRSHTGEKPFTCKICKYKFSHSCHLVSHMRTHTGEKPYACKLCNYKCARNSYLVSHMTTHTGEKPYSCTLCTYKCAQNSHLMSHMKTHSGEKPYSCNLCSYKCGHRSTLVSHMRTHTGEKPYSCKTCSYKCARNSNLVSHMRTHTGEKRYSCKLCDYSCSNIKQLTRHKTTHSGGQSSSCS